MLDMDEIEEQIARREMGDTSWANCQALAILYTILDHHGKATEVQKASAPAEREKTGALGESEFLQAASGVDVEELMSIIDKHMEALKIVFPGEYESVISRIKAIG